jgi:hypothetical protein
MMSGLRWMFVWTLAFTTCFAGCGRSSRTPLGRVSGTVQYNGRPISSGSVVFEVDGARPAHGTIADGAIVDVTTYTPGDGVPVGNARIAVFATGDGGAGDAATTTDSPGEAIALGPNYMGGGVKSPIPSRYNDPALSGLTWTIQAGKNVVELNLSD